jgi:hypothetical protein
MIGSLIYVRAVSSLLIWRQLSIRARDAHVKRWQHEKDAVCLEESILHLKSFGGSIWPFFSFSAALTGGIPVDSVVSSR